MEIGLFYNYPRVKEGFTVFLINSADFLIFRRISVTRQFVFMPRVQKIASIQLF